MSGEGHAQAMIGSGAWTPPRQWHGTADVLVIGAGFAGLAAAAAAATAGSAVIVLDKMARYGGNSAINLGDYVPARPALRRSRPPDWVGRPPGEKPL